MTLLPSRRGIEDVLRCHIDHVDLNQNPKYAALSYTWGNPAPIVPILLNEETYFVTESLAMALRHLREQKKGLTLWVDSVCINQTDQDEKSFQVGMMGRIYTQAAVVLAWLGQAEDSSDLAIDKMHKLGKWFDQNLEKNIPPHLYGHQDIYVFAQFWNQWCNENLQSLQVSNNHDADILPLPFLQLLSRQYWTRLWIQQEVKLARELIFVCGSRDIDKAAFQNATTVCVQALGRRKFDDMQDTVDLFLNNMPPGINMIYMESGEPLIEVLFHATFPRDCGCIQAGDPRDMVYGLLSIASDVKELAIIPDYAQSPEVIYQEVAEAYLRLGFVDILAYAGTQPPMDELPSWVANWSREAKQVPLSYQNRLPPARKSRAVQGPMYSASATTRCHNWGVDYGILRLSGLTVDVVSFVGENWASWRKTNFENINSSPPGVLNSLFCSLEENRPESHVYTTPGGWKEAVLRTLTIDTQSVQHTEQRGRGALRWTAGCEFDRMVESFLATGDIAQVQESYYDAVAELNGVPFITSKGYIGLSPEGLQVSDEICVLFGGSMPFAIRNAYGGTYRAVQQVYLHGIMYGEFLRFASGQGRPAQEFYFC